MLINELKLPMSISGSGNSATHILQKAGYELLGSGRYGYVFAKPGENTILKLFSTNDKGYIVFVNFCLANRSSSNIPVFKGKLINVNYRYYALRMERLTPTQETDQHVVNMVDRAMQYCFDNTESNDGSVEQKDDQEVVDSPPQILKKYDQELGNTVEKMCSYASDRGIFTNDMWHKNIMKRGNTFVLTDPL